MLRRHSAQKKQARELARLLAALDALGAERRAASAPRAALVPVRVARRSV